MGVWGFVPVRSSLQRLCSQRLNVSELSKSDMVLRTGGARAVSVFDGGQETQRIQVVDSAFHPDWNDTNFHDGVDLGLIYLAAPLEIEPVVLDSTPAPNRTETGHRRGLQRKRRWTGRPKNTGAHVDYGICESTLTQGAEQPCKRNETLIPLC